MISKENGRSGASRNLMLMSGVFGMALVDAVVIDQALRLRFADFEDAVTAAAADRAGVTAIISRDPKGFRQSPVTSFTPEAFLATLSEG